MARVKPTRVATPRIVQPGGRGVGRPWLWALLLVGFAAWTWQVYEFGRQSGGVHTLLRDRAESRQQARLNTLVEERDALRAEAARHERAAQIDRAAVEQVRTEVRQLQDERAELKREVAFLRTMLPAAAGVSGAGAAPVAAEAAELVLQDLKLEPAGERAYRLEITVAKREDDDRTMVGQAVLSVSGSTGDDRVVLDMKTLTKGKRDNIGLRFRNFQRLKTDIELPEDFAPATIDVAVKPDGKAFKPLQQAYDWKPPDA